MFELFRPGKVNLLPYKPVEKTVAAVLFNALKRGSQPVETYIVKQNGYRIKYVIEGMAFPDHPDIYFPERDRRMVHYDRYGDYKM